MIDPTTKRARTACERWFVPFATHEFTGDTTAAMAATMGGSLPSTGVRHTAIESHSIPEVDYGKLLHLFAGEHSAMLSDRHAAAIVRVCRVHEKGFPIRDLTMLQQVVRFAYDRVAEGKGAEFEEALCVLFRCVMCGGKKKP